MLPVWCSDGERGRRSRLRLFTSRSLWCRSSAGRGTALDADLVIRGVQATLCICSGETICAFGSESARAFPFSSAVIGLEGGKSLRLSRGPLCNGSTTGRGLCTEVGTVAASSGRNVTVMAQSFGEGCVQDRRLSCLSSVLV
jgi:hypothetical protein